MTERHLNAYYPDGISAEERLFQAGARCTRIPLQIWLKALGVGIGVTVLGLLILAVYGGGFGMFVFGLGDLIVTISIIGMGVYLTGLRYLERAELLYNTRLAGREDVPDNVVQKPAPTCSPVVNQAVRTTNGWVCSCGKQHPIYVSSCSCGVNKSEIC